MARSRSLRLRREGAMESEMVGSVRLSLGTAARSVGLAMGLAAALAMAGPGLAQTVQAVAPAAPVFVCRALPTQTCYFAVVSAATGANRRFKLKAREMLAIPGVAAGEDRYMVSINRLPPDSEANCGGQFDKRFSLWCKRGVVRGGENN